MPELQLTLLGAMQVRLAEQPLIRFGTAKVQALLAYLAVEAQSTHPRDTLIGLFWPDFAPDSAFRNLRQTLFRLRHVIPPAYLLVTNQQVQFDPHSDHTLDVATFVGLIRHCQQHMHGALRTCPECMARLAQAVELYRGDFLAGFFVDDSPAFEEWLLLKREWLRREALQALYYLAFYAEQQGDYDRAYRYAWRQVEIDPVREEAHQQLIRVLAASGRRSEALSQYESCRRLLADELGVAPSAATTALYTQVRAGAFADKMTGRQGDKVNFTLSPCLPVIPSVVPPAHNLPAPLTRFIGREAEQAEVRRLLAQTRLLTLTGAGGSGKTRLALHIANSLLGQYADGSWFVDLAPLADPELVAQTVATTLGVREQPGRSFSELLGAALQGKRLLLLLDNCEHLVDACAALAEQLLQAAPDLQILATSREALAINGELAWRVPGLARPPLRPLPPLAELGQFAAVQLFVARATLVAPGFALTDQNALAVAQICRRLDGLPLALELAAARSKLLSPAQITARLDDRFHLLTTGSRTAPSRQQTLRATLDWSYSLLTESERSLLQRLAVFAGSFTLEAVAAVVEMEEESRIKEERSVASPNLVSEHLLNLLGRLVDKSLVMVDQPPGSEARYRLLETIRQYAREQWVESEATATLYLRFARYYLRIVEEVAAPALDGPNQAYWYALLPLELDNLRTALAWSLEEPGQSELGLRLAGALAGLWGRHMIEGRRWLEELLAQTKPAATLLRAKALTQAAWLAHYLYDWTAARARIEEGVAICRPLGDPMQLFHTLHTYTDMVLNEGQLALGKELIAEAEPFCQQTGSIVNRARLEQLKGRVAWLASDNPTAQLYYEQALTLFQAVDHLYGQAATLAELGQIKFVEGDYVKASVIFQQALTAYRKLDDKLFIALLLWALGLAAKLQGHHDQASKFWTDFELTGRIVGYEPILTFMLSYWRRLATLQRGPHRAHLFAVLKTQLESLEPLLTPVTRSGFAQIIAVWEAGNNSGVGT